MVTKRSSKDIAKAKLTKLKAKHFTPEGRRPQLIDPCPVEDDRQWAEQLDELMRVDQLAVVRECLNRQRPFGKTDWQAAMATTFGLGSTLRPRGRPRNEKKSSLSPF
jgi:REP-associated tyrosine transposase